MGDNQNILLEVESDGIYLVINNSNAGPKVNRQDVLKLIEVSGVKDISFVAINDVFKSKESFIKAKISSNTNIKRKDESIAIEISKDKMAALIRFSPPLNSDTLLTADDVCEELKKNNIVFGIDEGAIKRIMPTREYGVAYHVVEGRPPVNGIDGYLKFSFDKDKKRSLKPKELEDGKVDFHSLDLIEIAECGQILVTTVPSIEGSDGVNVYGNGIPHKKGKMTPPLPKGKNVYVSDDGKHLIAEVNGQILYANNKVSVWPVLEIKGDVDNTTGNVDFNGSVVIKGNVMSGFSVNAMEDIDIAGVVESANITAGANLLLSSGVQGGNKANIIAGKDITAKFIESANVIAGGNIMCDSIMHSTVKCKDTVELVGKNGLLVGGKVCASNMLKAKSIGSSWATVTEIEVGVDLDKMKIYEESLAKLKKLEGDLERLDKVFEILYAANQKKELSEEKKNTLIKTLHTKKVLKQQIEALQTQINELIPYIDTKRGSVLVSDVIRHGVKVTIGNACMHIRDEIQSCKLVNNGEKVVIQSYIPAT